MIINKTSVWSESEIYEFLATIRIPIRVATSTDSYPTLCSVWYMFDQQQGELLCASHENSKLVADLKANEKCAFEIAPNKPPYCGVRGKAKVTLTREHARETLATLIENYLGDLDSGLAKWLLSRSDEEYVLRLTPIQITSWDYSERMG